MKTGPLPPTKKQAYGLHIANVLNLKPNRKGLYQTQWGPKTAHGLTETVLELAKDYHEFVGGD
jgi:hypothetical protein